MGGTQLAGMGTGVGGFGGAGIGVLRFPDTRSGLAIGSLVLSFKKQLSVLELRGLGQRKGQLQLLMRAERYHYH